MKLSRIIASIFFLFYLFLKMISAEESNLKILSSSRELSFHSENEDSKYYIVTYDSQLRLTVQGRGKLMAFVRVNIPREKTTLPRVPLTVQMDGLQPRRFLLPEARESTGIFLGETNFFPSRVIKLTLEIPDGEHIFTFRVPASVPQGVAVRFELLREEKRKTEVSHKIEFFPFVFGGGVSDSYGKQRSGIFGIGAGLNNSFTNFLFLSISVRYSFYPEEYHFFTSTNEERMQSGLEHLLNLNGFMGFNLLHRNIFSLSPLAGIYGSLFILGNGTNILLGPSGGLEAGVGIFDENDLKFRVIFTYDLLKESGEKPVGSFPFASLSYSTRLEIARIFFGYSGEYLMFPITERVDESGNVTRFAVNHRLYHSLICGYTF